MNAANAIPVPHPVVSPMPVGRRALAFGRHLVEMLIVMVVGMTILGLADGGVLRTAGLGAVRTERPLFDLVLMAVEMTLPMAAWMAYRGHARRDTIEMADAMLAPAVVLAALGVSGAVDPMTAEMVYHPLMLAAMVGVMLARRDVYAASHASHLRHAPGASAPDVSHSNPRASRASHEVTVMRHPSAPPSLRPPLARLAAAAAIAGILIELGAAMGHPSHVQPNDSARVFAEYAESQIWVQVHLAQFLGSLLVGSAILLIAMSMRGDRRGAPAFAFIAALTGVLALAVFAVQMAVDGVALKAAF